MHFSGLVSVCAALVAVTEAAKLPDYLKPCSKSDPKLNECALRNGREALPFVIKGNRKLNMPVLDPLVLEELVIDDKGNRAIGLTLICKDCVVTGLKDAKLEGTRLDVSNVSKKARMELDLFIPLVTISGKYKASGKVLILPIEGSGHTVLKMGNLTVLAKIDFDLIKKKDNKEYLKVTNVHMKSKVRSFNIRLENLFNGDKTLGDNMNRFLNENWNEVVSTFQPAVNEIIVQIVKNLLSGFINSVPFNEILPD